MKRKIAAILAADIVGYSRLVGEDEEDTLRRLENYRAVFADFIARFGGRIFNTAGDAILAEFPSAVDAVRCAVDTQESLRTRNLAYPSSRQMHFRIGITIGDVVEREGDLLGEGVNIASRLESIAPAGGICISRSVHEAVANKISLKFADVGEQQLKNLPDRVHAYTVTLDQQGARATVPLAATGAVAKPVWAALAAGVVVALAAGIYVVGFTGRDRGGDEKAIETVATKPPDTVTEPPPPPPKIDPPPKTVDAPPATETKQDVTAVDTVVTEEEEDTSPGTDNEKCANVDKEKTSIRACTRLLDEGGLSSSDRALYYSNRGAAHLNLGSYDLAIADLDESLRLDPDGSLAIYNRGATYFYKGDNDRALADLKRAVKLDPKHAKTQFYLGRTLQELGRPAEGLAHLARAIALDPDDASYRKYRADAYLDTGEYARAIIDYDDAIRLDPKYAQAFRGRGITWRNGKDTGKAIADLTQAVSLDPEDWYAHYLRAGAYSMEERYEEAIADHTESLRLDPNNVQVLNGRADARLNAGKLDDAWGDVERALGIDPDYALAITTRGEIYEAQGKTSAAIDDFRRALALDATIEEAKEGLARLDSAGAAEVTSSGGTQGAGGAGSCTKFLASVGKTIPVPCD